MSRQGSYATLPRQRSRLSSIERSSQSVSQEGFRISGLGGVPAIILFVVVLVAFVLQSTITQHVQTTLNFRHPFLIFYIAHSTFSLIFPLQLIYLSCTTSHSVRHYFKLAWSTLVNRFRPQGSNLDTIPTKRILTMLITFTIGMALPGLLWYIAVSMASVSDVTAIWNSNAFWAYLLSVILLSPMSNDQPWWRRLESTKLFAVAMACVGVGVVVYAGAEHGEGSNASTFRASDGAAASVSSGVNQPAAPLTGNLLTLVASVIYALVQVLYKKYIALPDEPTELDATASPAVAAYRSLATDIDDVEGNPSYQYAMEEDAEVAANPPTETSQLPFGLYANFVTSLVGVITFVIAWPLPLLLDQTTSAVASTSTAPSFQIAISIAAIALSGLVWNAGYLVLLGIWGPVIASVGNLLTIILMLIAEALFVASAPTPSFWSIIGCGMIAGGFAVLVWDLLRAASR